MFLIADSFKTHIFKKYTVLYKKEYFKKKKRKNIIFTQKIKKDKIKKR